MFERFSEQEQAILEERAQRIANAKQDSAQIVNLLRLRVSGEYYAVYLDDLIAIHEAAKIVPVPCVPPFLRGIANIRGRILPVIDLTIAMNIPGGRRVDQQQLVVVECNDEQIVLLIDKVEGVSAYEAEDVEDIPADMSIEKGNYTQGVLPDGTLVLDVKALLNDPRFIIEG